ncbi:MAG TPA: YbaB/EbfC family nucleoid-associated protein [Fibrobacteria bacterium]|nr:YbaB/EbfC family nucleoid-associated protein [Fibrobacteria bacterium]
MDMKKMMKELQKMQGKMANVQKEMESALFEAEAGGGMVKLAMNGKYEVQSVKLARDAVDPEDMEALEDLLLAAFNAAKAKVDDASQEKMGGLTKGLGIPGL